MGMASSGAEDAGLVVEFDDNRLAALLYGAHNRNLALIEERLGVSLQNRGNQVRITGGSGAVSDAAVILERLYDRAKSGRDLETADVEAAIRLRDAPIKAGSSPKAGGDNGTTAAGAAGDGIEIRTRKRVVTPRSPGQIEYIQRLQDHQMVFGLGPAGTGKTFLAVAMAVAKLVSGTVDRIILSRPAVEAGERLGFLPGDLREKVDPYLRPLYDALYDTMPGDEVTKRFERGEIEVAPLAYMRGRTLANCCVILDEAQNTTPMQMKMFLTRFGENCHMVIAGDPSQTDLPAGKRSGLLDALSILKGVPGIAMVQFKSRDVVRHALVGKIVDAYDNAERRRPAGFLAPEFDNGSDDGPGDGPGDGSGSGFPGEDPHL